MREAVIVSTARTPIGKAYRGAFNDTTAPTLAAPVINSNSHFEPCFSVGNEEDCWLSPDYVENSG